MAYFIQDTRSIGTHVVGAIERIYRCDNGFGAVVIEEPPGLTHSGRITVTPVRFFGDAPDDYEVVQRTDGAAAPSETADPLGVTTLETPEELEATLARIDALPPHADGDRMIEDDDRVYGEPIDEEDDVRG